MLGPARHSAPRDASGRAQRLVLVASSAQQVSRGAPLARRDNHLLPASRWRAVARGRSQRGARARDARVPAVHNQHCAAGQPVELFPLQLCALPRAREPATMAAKLWAPDALWVLPPCAYKNNTPKADAYEKAKWLIVGLTLFLPRLLVAVVTSACRIAPRAARRSAAAVLGAQSTGCHARECGGIKRLADDARPARVPARRSPPGLAGGAHFRCGLAARPKPAGAPVQAQARASGWGVTSLRASHGRRRAPPANLTRRWTSRCCRTRGGSCARPSAHLRRFLPAVQNRLRLPQTPVADNACGVCRRALTALAGCSRRCFRTLFG